MRIVHIITRLIVGGAQENTLLSCEGQHDLGHDVTLITGPAIGPEGSLMDRARGYGYRVEVVDEMRRSILPIRDYRSYHRMVRCLQEIGPDVVHTHSSKAGIIGRWAADRAKVPVIVHTIHGLAFTASKSRVVNHVYKMLERQAAPLTDRIVCVADDMRDQSLAGGVGVPKQYVTVYSGMATRPFVEPATPREVTRSKLGIESNHVVAGTIARLFHMKGHEDLLALAPELCRKLPNLRFMWVGDGLLREQFQLKIRQMRLEDRFIFTGLVPPEQVPELAAAMDILVHPSRREGLARALPQGQLAGCPAVTYDVDGNREGLLDGTTGMLIKAFDVPELGRAIERLTSDGDLRRTMGRAGRAFALSRFDTSVMVAGLEAVYRKAWEENRPGEAWNVK
ncbi:glycosyltransferase family 4 protein [Humisphaera borealis]|uniref:Glycosyltransferase family 4 protein n=1 Tax=Humisphaera borealis TaxID=2807512 RepID=A0A7M2X121_9BACT|nr:glycosyltransferase family 4 protein [Humisphaera borealis]QOV91369.1 glycosyltransferase family 4 protein [Humisphaera borealis]